VRIVILNLGSESLLGDVTLQVRFNVSPCFNTIDCPNGSSAEENSNSYPCSVQFSEPGNGKIRTVSLLTVITLRLNNLLHNPEVRHYGTCKQQALNSVIVTEHNSVYIHLDMSCTVNLYAHSRCDTSVQAYNNTKINTAIFNSVKAIDAF
jgi:hypothetical protein